jgi:AraC-like DNA-binding protein
MQLTDITIGPNVGYLAILNLLGAAQGVLLALALLTSKAGGQTANRLMAALTLTISIAVSGAVLLTSNYVFAYPHLSRVHQPFVFLAAPLLFLYIRELTAREPGFERKDFLHFIPFVACLVYLLPYYFQNRTQKIQILLSEFLQESFGAWYYIRSALLITQVLVYLILVVLMIIRYSRKAKERDSARDRAVLFEVRFFVFATAVLWVAVVLRYAIPTTPNLLVPLGASLLIYGMGYLKLRRPEPETGEKDEQPARKYEKSTLTPERSERYLDKLINFMEKEKPFTDGDLTIQKLAEKLSIPANHLSQTINERLGQTFSDFVNSYRVEAAKRKLLDPAFRHLSVLGIAEEVGFSSKSSFNSVFKKHTNMTPSEFRNAAGAVPANSEPRESSIKPSLLP